MRPTLTKAIRLSLAVVMFGLSAFFLSAHAGYKPSAGLFAEEFSRHRGFTARGKGSDAMFVSTCCFLLALFLVAYRWPPEEK